MAALKGLIKTKAMAHLTKTQKNAVAILGLGMGLSAALLPGAASAGISITTGSPANDAAFECLKGNPAIPACTPAAIQENWVAEGRIGKPNNADWQQGIVKWKSNIPNDTTTVNEFNDWTNGIAKTFTVTYLSSGNGTVNYELGNPSSGTTTITANNLTRTPPITTLYIRAASFNPATPNTPPVTSSTTSLTLLFLDLLDTDGTTVIGAPIQIGTGSLISTNGSRNYITVDGVTGNFRVRGDATLTWTGGQPTSGSGLSWQIKAAYKTAEVPGPLPVLGGMAAFGWSRRLRRRLRQIPSTVSA